MNVLASLLSAPSNIFWTVVISGAVSAAITYYFKRRETRHKLEAEYEYEQRKKLRNLIGGYHGRLLNAAVSVSRRFWNLYANVDEGWLNVNGSYGAGHYYFHSCVYRFMNVASLIRQFEREAVFLDARIAEKRDFVFLQYLSALRWCVTDVDLFKGLTYDRFDETDHFFADTFRYYCDWCINDKGNFMEFPEFVRRLQKHHPLDPVLGFFDGLSRREDRLRWDRLVAYHLILVAFINKFGYEEQRTSQAQFVEIALQMRNREVIRNLVDWLPRHGLVNDAEAADIKWASVMAAPAAAGHDLPPNSDPESGNRGREPGGRRLPG